MLKMKFLGGVFYVCFFFLFFFLFLFSFSFSSSPCYSAVPAVHLITTVYNTVVRTRECVCVREAGRVTATLTHRLFCRQDVSLVSCEGEGECVAVLRPFISDLLPHILL